MAPLLGLLSVSLAHFLCDFVLLLLFLFVTHWLILFGCNHLRGGWPYHQILGIFQFFLFNLLFVNPFHIFSFSIVLRQSRRTLLTRLPAHFILLKSSHLSDTVLCLNF